MQHLARHKTGLRASQASDRIRHLLSCATSTQQWRVLFVVLWLSSNAAAVSHGVDHPRRHAVHGDLMNRKIMRNIMRQIADQTHLPG